MIEEETEVIFAKVDKETERRVDRTREWKEEIRRNSRPVQS